MVAGPGGIAPNQRGIYPSRRSSYVMLCQLRRSRFQTTLSESARARATGTLTTMVGDVVCCKQLT